MKLPIIDAITVSGLKKYARIKEMAKNNGTLYIRLIFQQFIFPMEKHASFVIGQKMRDVVRQIISK